MAGSGDLVLSANKNVLSHWKRQHKFVQQCELLALRARWWGILQKYHVKFDPRLFEEGKAKGKYVESLIPSVILSLSKTKKETSFILRTAMDFAEAFGLSSESAVQKYVEFLLSPLESHHLVQPDLEVGSSKTDVRMKLSSLEGVIKNLMRRLDPPAKRVNVLRNCLVSLENSNNGTDYERLSVVLCLYQAELSHLLSEDIGPQKMNSQPYLIELELVDRRRDALAILSSYFQGRKREERPPLSSFFAPLGVDTSTRVSKKTTPRILGNESEGSSEIFDPLKPLEKILRASCSSAVTSNLAPLCLPLGVPRGYIHARSLIARFQMSKVDGVALPSFELDVLPVLSRLKSPTDVAELAEWCSLQYDFENEDKLRCLDHSLNFALRASSEAEQRVNHTSRSGAIESDASESNALERVKRITSAKDMLADRLAINAILSSVGITSEKNCTLSTLLDDLISRLEQEVWNKSEFIPERFVEIFLSQSSLLASEASLCSRKALSVGQFRQLSTLVHRACKSVADKYSHVLVGHIARRLTRRWLFHGDELSSSEEPQEGNPLKENVSSRRVISHLLPEIDEGDTIDFVMDLDRLGEEENTWSADIGSGPSSSQNDSKVTSEEEQSSLKMASSEREKSELQHRRVALRVVSCLVFSFVCFFFVSHNLSSCFFNDAPPYQCFVMAYADGYHPVTTCNMSRDENLKPAVNHARESRISKAKSKGGLLSKIGTSGSKQQHDNVLEHCRELLGIVFAKSGVSDLIEKNLNMSTDSRGGSSGQRKTITFAMRHRALRASSILCPQEALEEVIQEEEYISATPSCSLKKCSFGSFVAKEIEEMGLPLPHSDLTQLSTMHFPSYARTLWRHHRDGKGSKGRILVLILEMYLKDTVSDFGFVISVLTEMITLNLPRSLLIALECVCSYMERKEPAAISSFMEGAGSVIGTVLSKVSGMIFAELKKAAATILVPVGSQDITDGLETLRRLGFVVGSISDSSIGQQNLVIFIESLLSSTDELSETEYSECINDIMINSLRRVGDKDTSKGLAEQFLKSTRKVSLSLPRFEPVTDLENDALCSSLEQLESSLDSLSRD